jgi:ABC-type transporter Mla subunit MlaD
MTAQPQPEPTLRDLADKLDKLTGDVDRRFDTLSQDFERSNDKFDNYQKATQWVVQLAFTLIASATITVILTSVIKQRVL